MRRIIVTGATGFIGANLVSTLVNNNYEVYTVSRCTSEYCYLSKVAPQYDLSNNYIYDGSLDELIRFFCRINPDVVVHVAAHFVAEHRPGDVKGLVLSNVLYSTEIFEATARSGCKAIINTSTSWQYYHKEGDIPASLYAATKSSVERIACYYADAFDLQCINLTIYDSYGPGDPRKKLISLLRNMAIHGGRLEMSPGEQKMNLVYIDDITNAYLVAIGLFEKSMTRKTLSYFLRANRLYSVREIVRIFEQLSGQELDVVWGGREYRDREVMEPYMGGRILPGWSPLVDLDEGVRILLERAD